MPDRDLARRAMAALDLTDLSDGAAAPSVAALCAKARAGGVAAVCVWPQWVSAARAALAGSPVRVATVVNFPHGTADVERVLQDTGEALRDGADEIDLVLPFRAFMDGYRGEARDTVAAVREAVDRGRMLKVILETGVLVDPVLVREASELAIGAGADFLKTSTGKTEVSATPDDARTMLDAIRASGRPVGLKVSGGIRTVRDAATYLDLADAVMGPGWATPATFRFGASGLYEVLAAAAMARPPA